MQQKQQAWGVEAGLEEMVDGGAHKSNTSPVSPPLGEVVVEEMELPVPADGIIPLSILLKNDTELLMIDVRSALKRQLDLDEGTTRPSHEETVSQSCSFCLQAYFEDSHNSLQLHQSYSSASHSYLQIQKPPTPAQVRKRGN